jgi:hypothetical protein
MGLLTVQERRREGQKNLPNVVRIVSKEWQQWIKRGGQAGGLSTSKPIRGRNSAPTGKGFKRRGESGIPPEASKPRLRPQNAWENRERAFGRAEAVDGTDRTKF